METMTMNKHTIARRISMFLLAVAVLFGGSRLASAQATLNSTTTAGAVSATALTVQITSAASVSVGYIAYIDREAMLVTAVNTTATPDVITVQRGYNGTFAAAHATSALIYIDRANYFYASDPGAGSCTAAAQVVTPRINVLTGNITACVNSRWQGTNLTPFTYSTFPRTPVVNVAYTILPTDVFVSITSLSATRAMTLPSNMPAGHVVVIKDEIGLANTYNITVVGTIDGVSGGTMSTNYGVVRYYSSGSGTWFTW